MHDDVVRLLHSRRGHFRLESGHHGDLWLDLEALCLHPGAVRRLAEELAARLRRHDIQVVCGPLVEGAFVGLLVASGLDVSFVYSQPGPAQAPRALYPLEYRLPGGIRSAVAGRRVAIINDVVNAGSAVRGTYADLQACDARVVAIGALAVLGDEALAFARQQGVALEALASLPNELWTPMDCPLCAAAVPLEATAAR
jgi:orotate phosphoribosyltransferase